MCSRAMLRLAVVHGIIEAPLEDDSYAPPTSHRPPTVAHSISIPSPLTTRALLGRSRPRSFLAEMVGYALAVAGCWCQWHWGFAPPFPLNIVLMPFTLVEWYLRWSIGTSATGL